MFCIARNVRKWWFPLPFFQGCLRLFSTLRAELGRVAARTCCRRRPWRQGTCSYVPGHGRPRLTPAGAGRFPAAVLGRMLAVQQLSVGRVCGRGGGYGAGVQSAASPWILEQSWNPRYGLPSWGHLAAIPKPRRGASEMPEPEGDETGRDGAVGSIASAYREQQTEWMLHSKTSGLGCMLACSRRRAGWGGAGPSRRHGPRGRWGAAPLRSSLATQDLIGGRIAERTDCVDAPERDPRRPPPRLLK